MDNLNSIAGIQRIVRVKNEGVRMMYKKKSLTRHINKSLLRSYGHVGCMAYDRLVKKIHKSIVKDTRKGRP